MCEVMDWIVGQIEQMEPPEPEQLTARQRLINEKQKKVLDALGYEWRTRQSIAEETGVGLSIVRDVIAELMAAGEAECREMGWKKPNEYRRVRT